MSQFSKPDFLHEAMGITSIRKDAGIMEIYPCQHITVGISYETIDEPDLDEGYIFNLFLDGEYINVPGTFRKCEDGYVEADTGKRIEDVLDETIEKLNQEETV